MAQNNTIRWGWLKFMYIYTLVGAGGVGLGVIFAPGATRTLFALPAEDPVMFGITGGVYLAFALVSILGLRSPLKFAPILLVQLGYKVIWFAGVILPLLLTGSFPSYGISICIIYATFVIGDLIAIPFSYLFSKQQA